MRPEDILPTYEAKADAWSRLRSERLFERGWLDLALAGAPGRRVLDLGCGTGKPVAAHLVAEGAKVTGVDGAAAMIRHFRRNLPEARAVVADMRRLALGEAFDMIVAWDSFFHLAPDDQRGMFPVFAAHAAAGATLLFTSGWEEGEAIGAVDGAPVYHASLAPAEYCALLAAAGFEPLRFVREDPDCGGHTVWLARKRG